MKIGAETTGIGPLHPLGQRLREEREQKGRTLRQIADRTRIPLNVLEAIEEGDAGRLPAPVFVKGFIRSYAIEVGLSPQEVLREYKALLPEQRDPETVPITARGRKEGGAGRWIVVLALIVALAAIGWYMYPKIKTVAWVRTYILMEPAAPPEPELAELPEETGDYQPPSPLPDSMSEPAPAVKPVEDLTPKPGEADKPDTGPAGDKPAMSDEDRAAVETASLSKPPETGHELTLVFKKTSWAQVTSDGGAPKHGLFKAGDTMTYKADANFLVRLGNAGGVKVVFDGEDLGPIGAEGRAVSLSLPKPK